METNSGKATNGIILKAKFRDMPTKKAVGSLPGEPYTKQKEANSTK